MRRAFLLAALPAILAAQSPKSGIDPAFMDRAVKPCADFYGFANGAYDKTPIPAAYAAFGVNQEIDDRNDAILHRLLDAAALAKAAAGTPEQRIGDFYASGMDEAAIAKNGVKPLAGAFAKIASIKDGDSLADACAWLSGHGLPVPFSFFVSQDDKDATAMIVSMGQTRFGLPEREFYFRQDAKSRELRAAYQVHVARMFELSGESKDASAADARTVLDLETALAAASRKLVDLRDPEANYHKTPRTDLPLVAPGFAWERYFAGLGLPATEKSLNLRQPDYLAAFAALSSEIPAAKWRALLKWRTLASLSSYLPKAFEDESFDFYGKTMSGRKELLPRWRRVKGAVDGAIGFDLGKLYVAEAFSPEAKAAVQKMVDFHKAAMRQIIQDTPWMGEATKQKAMHKLDTLVSKVGYPDKWRDYSSLKISRDSYAGNELATRAFDVAYEMAKLGKPVDRTEWTMTPPTNNAYYNPSMNEIVLPAGILQPPFFDPKADEAANYGALASTIGHELTHAFDDEGSQYDADGNLKAWWTPEDRKAFESRAAGVIKQYDGFEAVPGVHLNGKQTLGENIADIGGLKVAYLAFQMATKGKTLPAMDGLTPDQRFFV
ncbi:MAG TPA: M13 family metallopeptidase, partial [Holophagaceae bacterium]|nr:M13 family metallopeptidase [Holophagaceae bacterium]